MRRFSHHPALAPTAPLARRTFAAAATAASLLFSDSNTNSNRGGTCQPALRSPARAFHSQHRTPIIPQARFPEPTATTGAAVARPVRVGYLLQRAQVVKHTPHPVEVEMAYLLEREHQRYARHEGSESATHFFASRGQNIDAHGRTDPTQIRANFFGLELYQDAMRVVLQRYAPEPRVTAADFWDPAALSQPPSQKQQQGGKKDDVSGGGGGEKNNNNETSHDKKTQKEGSGGGGPPQRHTLSRALDDYLYLIIRQTDAAGGRWTVPSALRLPGETLRMTLDRAVSTHHADALDVYAWSNAPQAVVRNDNKKEKHDKSATTSASNSNSVGGASDAAAAAPHASAAPPLPAASVSGDHDLLFLYTATYLSGRPNFALVEPRAADHAWVTRAEMKQYRASFESPELLEALLDIAPDSTFGT